MLLFRSNQVERLVERLVERVRAPRRRWLEPETVVVQSMGMERWLSQALSERLGVWALPDFPFPHAFVERVLQLGLEPTEADPWSREGLRWALSALLPDLMEEPVFGPLAAYLDDPDPLKPLQLAHQLADLLDRYQVWRPEMVQGWQQGAEPDDWQASLWRALRAHLPGAPLPERVLALERHLAEGPTPDELPERVHVFGLTAVPPLYLHVLELAARHTELCIYQLSPSAEYIGDLLPQRAIERVARRAGATADALHLDEGHPLLASLGRLGRQAQQLLLDRESIHDAGDEDFDDPGEQTMLRRLQHDILHLIRRGVDAPQTTIGAEDDSIEVHRCHGRLREVEVVRERLLAAFAADPELRPDQVVVMVPDIESYAPLVEAVFGVDRTRKDHIPFRVADRTAHSRSGPVASFLKLLRLLQGRLTAPEVMDWLADPDVLRRFELAPSDVQPLRELVSAAGIRWGLDAEHRVAEGLPADSTNTWRFGVERLLVGAAMELDHTWQGVLPLDGMEGTAAALAGRLARVVDTLGLLRAATQGTLDAARWRAVLLMAIDLSILGDEASASAVQRLRDTVVRWTQAALVANAVAPLPLAGVRWLLEQQLSRHRAHHVFLTGGVTVCAMQPLRAVPFEVVCLLGLAEGQFPRQSRSLDFDRIAAGPLPGDRDLRDEDRWLFLEAVLSARKRLVCTFDGRSPRDDSPRPMSVCLEALLGSLEQAHDDDDVMKRLVVEHPLSLASADYFLGQDPRLTLSSQAWADAARARADIPQPPTLLVDTVLPPSDEPVLDLPELVDALIHPARALARTLGLRLPREVAQLAEREPLEPDGLERFQLSHEMMRRVLGGEDPADLLPLLRAEGRLPPGAPGEVLQQALLARVSSVARVASTWLQGEPQPPLRVDLPLTGAAEGARLVGWIEDRRAEAVVHAGIHAVRGHHHLRAWIHHLALCLCAPAGVPKRTVLIGRDPDSADVAAWELIEVEEEEARRLLTGLVWMARRATRGLLPFFPEAGWRYVCRSWREGASLRQDSPHTKAMNSAEYAFHADGRFGPPGEEHDPWVQLVVEPGQRNGSSRTRGDSGAPLDVLDPEWSSPDGKKLPFYRLAWRLYVPLLAHRRALEVT